MKNLSKIPSEYNPQVFQRILDDLYRRIGETQTVLGVTRLAVGQTLSRVASRIGLASSGSEAGTERQQRALPVAGTVTVKQWLRVVTARFPRLSVPRLKGVARWEWQTSNNANFEGTEDGELLGLREFETLPRGNILTFIDVIKWGDVYVRVRAVGYDGSVGAWSTGSTAAETEDAEGGTASPQSGDIMAYPIDYSSISGTGVNNPLKFLRRGHIILTFTAPTKGSKWDPDLNEGVGGWDDAADIDPSTDIEGYNILIIDDTNSPQTVDTFHIPTIALKLYPGTGNTFTSGGGWVGKAIIPWLTPGHNYKFYIIPVGKGGKEGWTSLGGTQYLHGTYSSGELTGNNPYPAPASYVVISEDGAPTAPTIYRDSTVFSQGLVFMHSNERIAIDAIDTNAAMINVQWKVDGGAVWWGRTTSFIDALDTLSSGDFSGMKYIDIGPLIPGVTYDIRARVISFKLGSGGVSSWSGTIQSTQASITFPVPTEGASRWAKIIPQRLGWLKGIRYRLAVNFEQPADFSHITRWICKVTRKDYSNAVRYFSIEIPSSEEAQTVSTFFSLTMPAKNFSTSRDAADDFTIQVAPKYNMLTGPTWYTLTPTYATEEADTAPVATDGYPQWALIPGAWRRIMVRCVPPGWDFPDNFSHFSIHARINRPEPWTIDTGVFSKDRIFPWVSKEAAVDGVDVFVPMLVYAGTGSESIRWPLLEANFEGGAQGNLEVAVILHTYQISSGVPVPTASEGSYGSSQGNTGSLQYDPNIDDIFANFFVKKNMIAVYGGDLLFAPSAKIAGVGIFGSVVLTETSSLNEQSLQVDDICVVASATKGLFANSLTSEYVRVAEVRLGSLTIQRGWYGTKETINNRSILVKVGERGATYRFIWMDAQQDRMVIAESTCSSGLSSGTITLKYPAEFGLTTRTMKLIAPLIATNEAMAESAGRNSGVRIDETGIEGRDSEGNIRFKLSNEGEHAGIVQIDGAILTGDTQGIPKKWVTTCAFSSNGTSAVNWSSGSLTYEGESPISISSGTTGTMSGTTYIYYLSGEGAFRTTTTASTALSGTLIAVGNTGSRHAEFFVFDGKSKTLVAADSIVAGSLAAITASTGPLTVTGNITVNGGYAIRLGKESYSSDVSGIWLGRDGSTAKMYIGDASKHLKWDGSNLIINGVVINGGTVSDNLLINSGKFLYFADSNSAIYGVSATNTLYVTASTQISLLSGNVIDIYTVGEATSLKRIYLGSSNQRNNVYICCGNNSTLSFFGATPVAKQSLVANPTTVQIRAVLAAYGLV